MRRAAAFLLLAAALAGCASPDGAPVAEQRLERPAGQSAPTRAGLDPGEAALAESPNAVPAETTPQRSGRDNGNVVVRGQTNRAVEPIPGADPRPDGVRAEHVRAWDKCVVSRVNQRDEAFGSANPVAATPEDFCRERLGMANRDAIPDSWSPN